MSLHDLVISNAQVVDGTGSPPHRAEVAVRDGVIAEVGPDVGRGRREIDADGRLVTPGFVDVHTHYDGQATWDSVLSPSSNHGVTTVVMGNCGVGFAPVRPENRERLIQLMEGVEDIPGTALWEGLTWEWETFGDYLNALERQPHDINVGAQLPHGPLRLHVMGERGATPEPPTPAEVAEMAELARQAMDDGALGFTTSRTLNHRTSRGEPTPTLTAGIDELVGIAAGLGAAGKGVLQVVSDFNDVDAEFALCHEMAASSGRPISITTIQDPRMPQQWRLLLDRFEASTVAGVTMRGQVGARAVGVLLGFQATLNPFMFSPRYAELSGLPTRELAAALSDRGVRDAVLASSPVDRNGPLGSAIVQRWSTMFRLGDPPNYEPDPATSVAAVAAHRGVDPGEVALDWMCEADGTGLLYVPSLNWADENLDVVGEMLRHPSANPGLSDGGAHVSTICDGSFPTTLLQWWTRDRPNGRVPVEFVVERQCRATAQAVGLADRGVLAPGYRADLNVIDYDSLALREPHMVWDLPAGGRRLLQGADGYSHTFVSGVEIMADGDSTGATPGHVIRGAQPVPT